MRFSRLFGIAALALVASFATANAQQRLQVGVLECPGGQNVGFVVGSTTQLNCVFQSEGRRPEPYVATVQRIGLDLGFTERPGFAWAVYAPTQRIGRGDLAGSYGGVGANASVGVGFGGNLLVGGSANAYRAAAAQPAGPDRPERHRRYRRSAAAPGRSRARAARPASSPASLSPG